MQSLEKRVTALEQVTTDNGFPDTIFILFKNPGQTETEIHKLCNSSGVDRLEWLRGPDESEREFEDRASREVPRNAGGIAMLSMCE